MGRYVLNGVYKDVFVVNVNKHNKIQDGELN